MKMEDVSGSQITPAKGDYSNIELKPDHTKRPLWICKDLHIFLEPTTPSLFERATEFLISIAEPVSRPHYIHEYCLTEFSLHTAASIGQDRGLNRENIIKTLDAFGKNLKIPEEVISFINRSTAQYGRAKIIIKNKKYSKKPVVLFHHTSRGHDLLLMIFFCTFFCARDLPIKKYRAPPCQARHMPSTRHSRSTSPNRNAPHSSRSFCRLVSLDRSFLARPHDVG